MSKFLPGFSCLVLFFGLWAPLQAQDKAVPQTSGPGLENYREQIKRLVGFLEFSLNTLGDPETSAREKETIINESYSKAFLNDKVQVEDDLDENREIFTYKDVQAYLKDVDFFFEYVEFSFTIQDIQALTGDNGLSYFKVTANRNIKGKTVENENIDNNKTRYIEINLDEEEQVLKIASIYTTKLNEAQELAAWWNAMPQEWKDILGAEYSIGDSLTLNQVDILNDSMALKVSLSYEVRQFDSYIYIGNDSLLVAALDTVSVESYDTLAVARGAAFRALRAISRSDALDVSNNLLVTDLYPVDQLSELKSLNISGTAIGDLFPARNLTRLTALDISGTLVADLDPIRYNTLIHSLFIDSSKVTSLAPVEGFTLLEQLKAGAVPVTDLSPLRGLPNLKQLDLSYASVGDISAVADLPALQVLDISGTSAESLDALQYLITLKKLSFENTTISDLAPLSRLDSLEYLYADGSAISDLEPLKSITALQKVYCDRTGVTRLQANGFMAERPGVLVIYESRGLAAWWEGLPKAWEDVFRGMSELSATPTREELHRLTLITMLDVSGNREIDDLGPVAALVNLREIKADDTGIADLAPLSELSDIRFLSLAGTGVTDLRPLSALGRMERLDLTGTATSSLEGLQEVKNLSVLRIDSTRVTGLEPVSGLSSLKTIYADGSGLSIAAVDDFLDKMPEGLVVYRTPELSKWWTGLDPAWKSALREHVAMDDNPTREQLHQCSQLPSVDLSGKREIVSLSPLTRLSRLEEIGLANCNILDISPVSSFKRLKSLDLSGNPVSDLSPLSAMTGLRELNIGNTPVEKLDALETITSLQQLNCSGTQIKKLDPVASLTNLRKLECQNTGINNLKPLLGLLQLRQLVCYNTKLTTKKIEAFKSENPSVEVVFY